MKRYLAATSAALAVLSSAPVARAGVYADDLSRCLVKSATTEDKQALIIWIFSAIALHPDVSPLANISDARRKELDKAAGQLFERLMTKDCRAQTVDAVKYEKSAAIETSFSTLGEVAMTGLMSHPRVAAGMEGLTPFLDTPAFQAVIKEATAPIK